MENEPNISIIVPVYNEEETVSEILKELIKLDVNKEIIVVDDGSDDRTLDKIENIRKDFPQIRCIRLSENMGKGNAIREAVKNARGKIVTIQDADREYNPRELVNLVDILLQSTADVVYGIRFSFHSQSPFWHRFVNKSLTLLASILYFRKIRDMETCYKVMYKKNWEELNLKSRRFEVEAEITAKILRKKLKLIEFPISYKFRSYKEGKKISFSDGLRTLWVLLKYRFSF